MQKAVNPEHEVDFTEKAKKAGMTVAEYAAACLKPGSKADK